MTAAAPASSASRAWSASTTSMMTPPLSISASPAFTRNVLSSRMLGGYRAEGTTGRFAAASYFSRNALMRSSYWAASRE